MLHVAYRCENDECRQFNTDIHNTQTSYQCIIFLQTKTAVDSAVSAHTAILIF